MIPDLRHLIDLQEMDARIQELEKSKEEFPRVVEQHEATIARAANGVAGVEGKLAEAKAARKKAADEIESARVSLENTQERLRIITTNREYDAVHAEIEAQKHILANGESRLKTHSDLIEKLEATLEETRKASDDTVAENQPKAVELKERIATIDSEIAKLLEQRETIAAQIPKMSLRPYERIRTRRKAGPAIGLMAPDGRSCPICFKVLEMQLINEIRKSERLNTCENCGSLLIRADVSTVDTVDADAVDVGAHAEAQTSLPREPDTDEGTDDLADSVDPGEEVSDADSEPDAPDQLKTDELPQ